MCSVSSTEYLSTDRCWRVTRYPGVGVSIPLTHHSTIEVRLKTPYRGFDSHLARTTYIKSATEYSQCYFLGYRVPSKPSMWANMRMPCGDKYTPIRVRPKGALPKSLEFPKLPPLSLETDLQLRHWQFATCTRQKKTLAFTKSSRDRSVRQKHGFLSNEDGGISGMFTRGCVKLDPCTVHVKSVRV